MSSPGDDQTRTNLTPIMERYFIDLMLDQMHRGNRMGHTFNKQAWTDILTMFNAKFGTKYDRDILKSHYTNLWKQYNDVKNLLEQNGFSWDDTRKMVIADDEIWDAFIKAHPDTQCYKRKSLMNFTDLCLIYAYTEADGRYSRSSHDVDLDDDIQGNIGSLFPPRTEREKSDWTQEMDRYFIELMLDQLKKGNGRDKTFSKQAWKHMLYLFNGKFGSQRGKNFLKQRFKKLFKYYCDIKSLLERKGFSWDERQQMIVADDAVWENCIKGFPDAHSYRRKTLLNYQGLSVIFGNQAINGHGDLLHYNKSFEDRIVQVNSAAEKDIYSSAQNNGLGPPTIPEMDRYLIDLLQDQALRGNKIGHDLTMEAWDEIIRLFNEKFGSHYGKGILKNRYEHLRRRFSCINFLLQQNGFSWDENHEMVTAEDYVWDSFIEVHSDARSYRNICVPSYHKLCVIFGEETSNGRYSLRTHNVDTDNNGPALTLGEAVQCYENGDHLRTYWTPSMDRYFIDLMLKQVSRGNKIGYTSGDQAWIDMVVLFKEKFDLEFDTHNLKSRYKSLGKLFDDMKNLLTQRRFYWDEQKQLIRAYSDVWDAYIKESPYVKSYKTKCKPNYNDLHLIYGNSSVDGVGNQLGPGAKPNKNHYHGAVWNLQMDRFFIDMMLEHVRSENMVKLRFNEHAWSGMIAKFSSEFGTQQNKDVFKNRFLNLRKLFNDMKNLLDRKGFSWDEARQMIIANEDLWNSYVKEYPDALLYRNRALPNYNDLFFIFGETNNNQRLNYSCQSMAADDYFMGLDVAAEDMLSLVDYVPLQINWTKAMEVYFIQLLLEQVLRGNKIGQTLNEQAWSWIVVSFSEKFGLLCGRYLAESWYLSLMDEYNNITDLLNQNGFSWDEIEQTVVADDRDWKLYLKGHPGAIKYKDRILNSYSDLCVIYGSETPVGSLSYSGAEMEIHHHSNAADMGLDGIFEDAASLTGEFETLNHRKKRKPVNSSTSVGSRKVQRQKMENWRMTSVKGKECISIEVIVNSLQAIPGIDDELFLEACKLLEIEKNAKVFVAMDVNQRRKWLFKKLHI